MKKILITILCGTMLFSLAACAPKQQSATNDGTKEFDQVNQEDEVDVNINKNIEVVFGKINDITGNEIKLSMADLPEPEVEITDDKKEGETSMAAVEMVPAESGEISTGRNAKMELKYSGEENSFTIPSGASIKDTTGKDKKLTDLKKGAVVSLAIDEETKTITEVSIWE